MYDCCMTVDVVRVAYLFKIKTIIVYITGHEQAMHMQSVVRPSPVGTVTHSTLTQTYDQDVEAYR